MFCPNCGNELKPGVKFCNGCGHPMIVKKDEDIKIQENEIKEQSVVKNNKKKYTGFIVLLVALGIIFAGLVVAYFTIDDPQTSKDNDMESTNGEVAELSDEDILTNGYWIEEQDRWEDICFKPIEDDTYDGIMIMEGCAHIPYICEDNGKVKLHCNATDSDGQSYINGVDITISSGDDINSLYIKWEEGIVHTFINIDHGVENDVINHLKFNLWSDYDGNALYHQLNAASPYVERQISDEAQTDMIFYSFYSDKDIEDLDKGNLGIANYFYGDWEEYGFNASDFEWGNYSIDVGNGGIYINGDRYNFSNDYSQLYCEETDHTIYRITDFAFGKIADTDFLSGEFVE